MLAINFSNTTKGGSLLSACSVEPCRSYASAGKAGFFSILNDHVLYSRCSNRLSQEPSNDNVKTGECWQFDEGNYETEKEQESIMTQAIVNVGATFKLFSGALANWLTELTLSVSNTDILGFPESK